MNNPKEEILKLKEEIKKEELKIEDYKFKIINLNDHRKIKKLVDLFGYTFYLYIAFTVGLPASIEWFLILLITCFLLHNAVTMVGFDTKEEIEEKKKNVKEWIKESKEKIDELERKIYFLENPIKKEEVKHSNEFNIKDYKTLDKDIVKKLVR